MTIVSILENISSATNVNFHIFENSLSVENKIILQQLVNRYGVAKIIFYNIEDSSIKDFPEIDYLSKSTYLRLFMSSLLPKNIEKILYLDCDIVVLKDLQTLYEIDLKNSPLAAVEDPLSKEVLRTYFYPGLKKYFNAGVLLINPQAWRELNIKEKAVEFIKKYYLELKSADQDVLNCLFIDNWLELPSCYNTFSRNRDVVKTFRGKTFVLHYVGNIKPWNYLFVSANKKHYFKYLKLTPFFSDFKYKDKNFKNRLKRRPLIIFKKIKISLRKITPKKLIKWRRSFLTKQLNAKNEQNN